MDMMKKYVNASRISDGMIALPVGPHLDIEDMETIAKAIKKCMDKIMNDTQKLIGKKIVLIGGGGFIGHNLALNLSSLGAKVEIIDGMQVNNLLSLLDNVDNLPYPDLARAIINERTELLRHANINLRVQDVRDYHAIIQIIK